MVEDLKHVLVVSDLLMPRRIFLVDVLVRDLLEHGCEVHIAAGIGLDEFLELLNHRNERFFIILSIIDLLPKPGFVGAVIGGKPCSGSGQCQW